MSDDHYTPSAPSIQDQLHDLATFTFPRPPDPEEDPTGRAAFRAACEKIDKATRQTFLRFPSTSILERLEAVDTISFSHCGLGDKGVVALGEALKVNQTVTALDLSDNGITHLGLTSLLTTIPKTIKTLDLSSNRLARGSSICLSSDLMYVKDQQQQQQAALANFIAQQQKEAEKAAAKKAKRESARSAASEAQQQQGASTNKGSKAAASAKNVPNKDSSNLPQTPPQPMADPAAAGVPPLGSAAAGASPTSASASALGLQQNALGLTVSAHTGASGSAIGHLLSKNTTLQILSLKANKLNDTDIFGLAEGLAENSSLFSLDLSHNEIGPSCAGALATVLLRSELKEINLEWNQLQNAGGVTLIKEGLPVTTVKRIFLAWNGLGDEAAEALGKVLAGSSTLEELDISNNHIGPKGAALFAKGVQTSIALTVLVMHNNPLTEEGCLVLLRAISENTTLTIVDLRSTGAGKMAAELLPSLISKKLDAGIEFEIDMPREAAADIAEE